MAHSKTRVTRGNRKKWRIYDKKKAKNPNFAKGTPPR